MLLRTLATAAAGALVATLTVAPAQAAGYSATLKTSVTKADVHRTFTLSGKISGSGSAHKKLTVQRRIGTGGWTALTSVTTTSKSTFSKKITVRSAGAKQYRVLVPGNARTARGYSPAVTVTGWAWLDLYDESYLTSGLVARGWYGQLNGRTAPAHTFAMSSTSFIGWRLDGLCDRVIGSLELPDNGAAPQTVYVTGADGESAELVQPAVELNIDESLVGESSFSVRRKGTESYLALKTPHAHCAVAALPIAFD